MIKILKKKENVIEQIATTRDEYLKANREYKKEKCKLMLETDFETILNKSRPTVDEKNAYVDLNTLHLKEEKDKKYNEIKYLEMKLELINDNIELKKVIK